LKIFRFFFKPKNLGFSKPFSSPGSDATVTVSRRSVRSVCKVHFTYAHHVGWNTLKIISRLISLMVLPKTFQV